VPGVSVDRVDGAREAHAVAFFFFVFGRNAFAATVAGFGHVQPPVPPEREAPRIVKPFRA
jgi:hypothetical protein